MRIAGLLSHNLHQKIIILTSVPVSLYMKKIYSNLHILYLLYSNMFTSAEMHFFQCIFWSVKHNEN